MKHWLKSLLLESSRVSAAEMLSPESVPRLPSWFVAHKTGLPRLPFLFVLNNELRLHPSLEGMESITPGKDQLNSMGALVAVTLRLNSRQAKPSRFGRVVRILQWLLWQEFFNNRVCQHKHVCQLELVTDRPDVKTAPCSRTHHSLAALAACSGRLAALCLH